MARERRVVIAGAGIAGLALALALRRGLAATLRVSVCDPALAHPPRADERAYAVAAGARRMLATLGVWDAVAAAAEPVRDMAITDSRLADPVRPVFLTFGGAQAAALADDAEPFAHILEAEPLARGLLEACRGAGVDLEPTAVETASPRASVIDVALGDGRTLAATLVVASDGARSRLREAAGIGWVGRPYRQTGLVATVSHARDHEGRAIQHFLPAGPFAILPLTRGGTHGHRSSIVWTQDSATASEVVRLDRDGQATALAERFGPTLGALALETSLRAHPLALGLARRYVAERLALVGDAAHVIHPIAGQGLNLGLADAAALAETIADAMRLGLDPGARDGLLAYERARRAPTLAMAAATDGLNTLFSTDLLPVRLLRDLGLGLVDRMPGLKERFVASAAALGEGQPRLMRGEAL